MKKLSPMTVTFADVNKQPISSFSISPGQYNNSYAITLFGEGAAVYGEQYAQSLLKLLENFANATPPVNVTEGMLWYDKNSKELKIAHELTPYIPEVPANPPLQPNPIPEQMPTYAWRGIGAPVVSSTAPFNTKVLWFDVLSQELKYYRDYEDEWTFVGVDYFRLDGTSTVYGNLLFTSPGELILDINTLNINNDGSLMCSSTNLNVNNFSLLSDAKISHTLSSVYLDYSAKTIHGVDTDIYNTCLHGTSVGSIIFNIGWNNAASPPTLNTFTIKDYNTTIFTIDYLNASFSNVDYLVFNHNRIVNLADPVAATDAVNMNTLSTMDSVLDGKIRKTGDSMEFDAVLTIPSPFVLKDNRTGTADNSNIKPNILVGDYRIGSNTISCSIENTAGQRGIQFGHSISLFTNTIIHEVKTPTDDYDLANKIYADALLGTYTTLLTQELSSSIKGLARVNLNTGIPIYTFNVNVVRFPSGAFRLYANSDGLFDDPAELPDNLNTRMGTIVSSLSSDPTTTYQPPSYEDNAFTLYNTMTKHNRTGSIVYVDLVVYKMYSKEYLFASDDVAYAQVIEAEIADNKYVDIIMFW